VFTIFELRKDLFSFFFVFFISISGFVIVFQSLFSETEEFKSVFITVLTLLDASLGEYDKPTFPIETDSLYYNILMIAYMLLSVIVLLNLVVAKMNSTHDDMSKIAFDTYFSMKSKAVKSFNLIFERNSACILPPPLNIVVFIFEMVYIYIFKKKASDQDVDEYSFAGTFSDLLLSILSTPVLPLVEIFELFKHLTNNKRITNKRPLLLFGFFFSPVFYVIFVILHFYNVIAKLVNGSSKVKFNLENNTEKNFQKIKYDNGTYENKTYRINSLVLESLYIFLCYGYIIVLDWIIENFVLIFNFEAMLLKNELENSYICLQNIIAMNYNIYIYLYSGRIFNSLVLESLYIFLCYVYIIVLDWLIENYSLIFIFEAMPMKNESENSYICLQNVITLKYNKYIYLYFGKLLIISCMITGAHYFYQYLDSFKQSFSKEIFYFIGKITTILTVASIFYYGKLVWFVPIVVYVILILKAISSRYIHYEGDFLFIDSENYSIDIILAAEKRFEKVTMIKKDTEDIKDFDHNDGVFSIKVISSEFNFDDNILGRKIHPVVAITYGDETRSTYAEKDHILNPYYNTIFHFPLNSETGNEIIVEVYDYFSVDEIHKTISSSENTKKKKAKLLFSKLHNVKHWLGDKRYNGEIEINKYNKIQLSVIQVQYPNPVELYNNPFSSASRDDYDDLETPRADSVSFDKVLQNEYFTNSDRKRAFICYNEKNKDNEKSN
jgi:hypothetical protein